jgi:steroid delta-isomerase-like uncharacterized protein
MDRRLMLARGEETIAAWNRRDPDAAVAHAAEDLIWRDIALPMPLHGRAAVRAAIRRYMDAFPDLRVDVTSETVDGNRLVREWTAEGMHRGTLMGVAPTGRAMRVFGVTVLTFDDDGEIIEGAMYWNPLGVLRQLGVVRPPAKSAAPA